MLVVSQLISKLTAGALLTGRAAQRLTETSGRQATTIHRLLQWLPNRSTDKRSSDDASKDSSDTGGRFRFNAR